jgi:hypothetical protein
MLRPNPIPLSGREKSPKQPERRQAKRVDVSIPLTIKILGLVINPPPITVETDDISLEGLSISMKIKTLLGPGRLSIEEGEDKKMVKYLLLDNKRLELGINILPKGGSIQAAGKVKWYDRHWSRGFFYVRVGIGIEWIESEHKEKWSEYLKTVYQIVGCLGN